MIFGTDGIRGPFGQAPMDKDTIEKIGLVLGQWLPKDAKIVVGSDTRASCANIRQWLLSYLGPVTVLDLGVVPTPVVAFETAARGAHLGIMITASHNPFQDNGLKFFDHQGLKVQKAQAREWSNTIEALADVGPAQPATSQEVTADFYRNFIFEHFKPEHFEGMKYAFDLAHGAGSPFIRDMARDLKMDAVFLADEPDGQNINKDVGALHTQNLQELVKARQLNMGFAFDGDADRLIVVDGEEVPGDIILYALTQILLGEGQAVKKVVGTIMCNMGLEQRLQKDGIELVRSAVGDQNVLKELVDNNLVLGGESSGHLIQRDLFPAGDGWLGALRIARALKNQPNLVAQAREEVPLFKTHEKSYRVQRKPPLEEVPELNNYIEELKAKLGDEGRVIMRYSGTEPKIRFYLEASDLAPWQDAIARAEALIVRVLG